MFACTLLFQAARAWLGGGWAAWAVLLAVGHTAAAPPNKHANDAVLEN